MSVLKDMLSKHDFVTTLLPANRTADANGVSVDTQDSVGVAIVCHVGLSGDTLSGSLKAELEVQHSDDGSSFTACANADISSPVTGTNTGTFAVIDASTKDELVYSTNYLGNKRYIRMVYNITGTHTNGMPASAVVFMQKAHQP
jgi:hypothetical protein